MQTLLSPAARAGYFTAAPPPAVTARPLAYHLPLRSISDRHVPSRTLSSSSSLSLPSFAAPNHRGSKLSFTTIRASSTPISQTFTSPNDESEKAKLLQVLFLLVCQFYSILFGFRENVGKYKNMKFKKLLMNWHELETIDLTITNFAMGSGGLIEKQSALCVLCR